MSKNVGRLDQVLRIVLGIVLMACVFIGPTTAWGYLGLIPLITGLVGTCPLYSLFKFQTCEYKKK